MLSKKAQHGIDVLVLMASAAPGQWITTQALAKQLHLSVSYLESIMKLLREHGFVRAVRGPGGGYGLSRSASAMSLWQVVACLQPEELLDPAQAPSASPTWGLELALQSAMQTFLETQTVADHAQAAWLPMPAAVPPTLGMRLGPRPPLLKPVAPNSVFQLSAFMALA